MAHKLRYSFLKRFFISSLLTNIVSGNLLVRALILNAETFRGDGAGLAKFARGSRVLRTFARMAEQVELAVELAMAMTFDDKWRVEPASVTMENVSCINTLLVCYNLQDTQMLLLDVYRNILNSNPSISSESSFFNTSTS